MSFKKDLMYANDLLHNWKLLFVDNHAKCWYATFKRHSGPHNNDSVVFCFDNLLEFNRLILQMYW